MFLNQTIVIQTLQTILELDLNTPIRLRLCTAMVEEGK